MTTAEILTAIRSISAAKETPASTRYMLNALAANVEAKVRAEEAANHGKGSAVAVLNRVIKSGGRSRPNLGGAWMDGDGRQCVCDSLLTFRLRNSLPSRHWPMSASALTSKLSTVAQSPMRSSSLSLPAPRLNHSSLWNARHSAKSPLHAGISATDCRRLTPRYSSTC